MESFPMTDISEASRLSLVETAVEPAIDKIAHALNGTPAGVGVLALLSFAVTLWRKTGLPLKEIHDTVDALAAAAIEAEGN